MAVKYNVSGAWRTVNQICLKVNGSWKVPRYIYHKVKGVWKIVYPEEQSLHTYYFSPVHYSAEEHRGNASRNTLYGIIADKYYGTLRTYPNDDRQYSDKDIWRMTNFSVNGDDYSPTHPSQGPYKIHFTYPPAGGFSDKNVYIYMPGEFGLGSGCKINNPQKINAGTYIMNFNGSTFTMVQEVENE